ncbi:MAG: Xaa-Pro dipeptidase [Parasphingorhabdus sp.]|jgi:Xaa-Pro dipeptidase
MSNPQVGSELPFAEHEFQSRIENIQNNLKEKKLCAVLLFDPENMYWLTGYQTIGYFTFQCLLVLPDRNPVLISRKVNGFLAKVTPTLSDFVSIADDESPVEVLVGLLNKLFSASDEVGLETRAWYLTVRDYHQIKALSQCTLGEWNDQIEPFRMIKDAEQIKRIRSAAKAAESGLDAALSAVQVGATENDLAAAMFNASIASGSEYLGHPPLVVSGERTALCFAMWKRRRLIEGDVVLLEAAGCVDRYHAMIARSAVLGKASQKQHDMAAVIIAVLEKAIETIKPGAISAEVDEACRKITEQQAVTGSFAHRTGYAIGIGFPPNWSEGRFLALRPNDPTVLQPGMTFHCVPTLFDDEYGMCFSESILVTNDGCEVLTQYPRKLFEIPT